MGCTHPLANANRYSEKATYGDARTVARGRFLGMFAREVRSHGSIAGLGAICAIALLIAGCGQGERQDAHEKSGTYQVAIVKRDFPSSQALAQRARMTIAVRNDGDKPMPNVAVTVESFSASSPQQDLADSSRPVWVIDEPPSGAPTVYDNTWASDRPLAPGATHTFVWRVTALVAGTHTVRYGVAAGLNGKARAQLAGGAEPQGSFTVRISSKPPVAIVDPATGAVVREGSGSSK
jgi:hypothetical protein